MDPKDIKRFDFLARISIILMILAFASIMITMLSAPFSFENLATQCICMRNYLAYANILFGIAILAGLIIWILLHFLLEDPNNKKMVKNLGGVLLIQMANFIAGVFFNILFTISVFDVI